MSHTPGPWAIARTNNGTMIRSEPQAGYLAEIRYAKDIKQHDANAKLIAAAPKLVDALLEIVELREAMVPVQSAELDAAANIARAALTAAGVNT